EDIDGFGLCLWLGIWHVGKDLDGGVFEEEANEFKDMHAKFKAQSALQGPSPASFGPLCGMKRLPGVEKQQPAKCRRPNECLRRAIDIHAGELIVHHDQPFCPVRSPYDLISLAESLCQRLFAEDVTAILQS